MMEPTDAALVERCLAGQREAFALLLRRHQGAVFGLACRWCRDRDDAADLAQETFVRAYRKLRTYKPEHSFRNWVLSVCANLGKNRLRSEGRRRKAHETYADLQALRATAPDPRKHLLEEAVHDVPEILRIPLVLKHVEGLSYEEIATVLGIGVSAAKMRVKRGRDELFRRLRPERGEGP